MHVADLRFLELYRALPLCTKWSCARAPTHTWRANAFSFARARFGHSTLMLCAAVSRAWRGGRFGPLMADTQQCMHGNPSR